MLLRCLIVFFLAAAAGPGLAEEPDYTIRIEVTAAAPDEVWKEISTRHFLVVGNAGERQLRRIAVDLEELRRQVLRILPGAESKSGARTSVVVFRNAKSFHQFQQVAGTVPKTAGYVHSGGDLSYITLNAGEKNRRALYHSFVHVLLQDMPFPLWLREGLAEYYSAFTNERYLFGEGRTAVVGYPILDYERLLREGSLIPLAELMDLRADSPLYDENDPKNVFRGESWAFVHFLHEALPIESLKRFITLLASGASQHESFIEVFRLDSSELESALRNYIDNSKTSGWPHTRVPYCMCQSAPGDWLQFNSDNLQASVKERGARTLSEAEIQFHLGDLMLHSGHLQKAEAYLAKAVRLRPEVAGVHTSLGLLRLRQSDFSRAAESLSRALELDPNSALAHFYYASLIRLEESKTETALSQEKLESMQLALIKALELAPHFEEARNMLIDVNVSLGRADLNARLEQKEPVEIAGVPDPRINLTKRNRWVVSVDQLQEQSRGKKKKKNN